MPLYTFMCDECNHVFERRRPMGTKANTCPQCSEGIGFIIVSLPAKTRVGSLGKGGTANEFKPSKA